MSVKRPTRTLLTGFGPFGSVSDNPSQRIAEALGDTGVEGLALRTLVLPVSYRRAADRARKALAQHAPDLVLLLGVACCETGLRIERTARNVACSALDVDGESWSVLGGAPERYDTREDAEGLAASLNNGGFRTRVSDDAGAYVCNRTYFAVMREIADRGLATRCLFVHVPAMPSSDPESDPTSGMSIGDQVCAMRLALRALAGMD